MPHQWGDGGEPPRPNGVTRGSGDDARPLRLLSPPDRAAARRTKKIQGTASVPLTGAASSTERRRV
jgi:hypothetical protein